MPRSFTALAFATSCFVSLAGLTAVPALAQNTMSNTMAAKTATFHATLSAAQEVPPKKSSGTGTLSATLNPSTRTLTYTVTYSGLTGPATAAHFHGPAAAGHNAGVQVPVKGSLASPIKGSAKLTSTQVTQLEGGQWYFNIHTKANPGGEIRGQVTKGGA